MAASVVGGLSFDYGHKMENIVFLHLRRNTPEVFYYRTASGFEVDFAVGTADNIKLIQVCKDISDEKTYVREIRSLKEAMTELKTKESLLITLDHEETLTFKEGTIRILPIWKYLLSQ